MPWRFRSRQTVGQSIDHGLGGAHRDETILRSRRSLALTHDHVPKRLEHPFGVASALDGGGSITLRGVVDEGLRGAFSPPGHPAMVIGDEGKFIDGDDGLAVEHDFADSPVWKREFRPDPEWAITSAGLGTEEGRP